MKFETKDLKAVVQVTILGIGKKEGRRSDVEIGNQDSDEFMSDCSIDEQVKEKFKQLEKKHDEDVNKLKQLLILISPTDRKQMVQEHFNEKEKYVFSEHSSKNDTLIEDKVNTYCITTLFALLHNT